ncbi:outer membrane beta-barrel protein [Cecembia rubra]|uniref:Uncharacterized protein n=1 Tax=Cecembia rubra TaxID=1485585 RepID=A0A2P8DXR0_9BACT|nr:outer membrane beta-barrel protein [Cecembia rubra]PSL02008.1 hypothetical protein CLV48_11197 [Cecembia rubra]
MKEQFDKKLVEKIRASFEDHEEAFDSKEWEKLSTAYFRPKKGLANAPWILWAASMIAVLGLGMLFFNLNKVLDAPSAEEIAETNIEIPNVIENGATAPGLDKAVQQELGKNFEEPLIALSDADWKNKLPGVTPNVPKIELPIALDLPKEHIIAKVEIVQSSEIFEDSIYNKNDLPSPFIAQFREQEEELAKASISAWLQEGKNTSEDLEENNSKSNPLKLGLLVAPQTVANSNQSLNLGGGLASEFSFSRRLKLDVGMVYASQNLSPNNSNFNSLLANSANEADSYRLSALNTNVVTATTELRFGQLEIPVNLKYMLWDKKSAGIYVLSGFSNMFFLNQRSVYTFSALNMNSGGFAIGQNAVQTFTQTVRPESGSDNGNMGQLINFGIGYEHSLSNGTFISVEPFYKTSLGGQTFLGQQLSIGGLNLRMNFQLKK